MIMLILSLFNFLLTVTYWIYTSHSMYNQITPTSPLPHILLLGLTLGSIASFLSVTLSPSSHFYQLMSESIFFTYSIIFSSMFIRLLCLRSLSSGVFLPFTYQTLLLAFIVLVQLSLSLQKLAMLEVKAGPQTDLMSLHNNKKTICQERSCLHLAPFSVISCNVARLGLNSPYL